MPIYFIGASIIAFTWVIFYFVRPDLRKLLIRGSVYGTPFGLTEKWFIPDYWTPPESLFNLIENWGFGIESLMVGFFVGGLASVVFPIFSKRKSGDFLKSWWYFGVAAPFLYGLAELVFPNTTIYNMIIVFALLSLLIVMVQPTMFQRVVLGSLFFAFLYIALFTFFGFIFPSYIPSAYQGTYLMTFWNGLPVEEFLFGLGVGAFWSAQAN